MPALFTSPRFVALSSTNQPLPGAKLYFRQTGTSTPQNTYQDEALTVPHANPVVADGAGVFSPIYLDPSLPNYRAILTDASDVTQAGYPIDNIPSNQNTGQTFRLKSAAPELIFEETDASAGNQKWRIRVNSEQMRISLLNDAESVATDIAIFDRTGSTGDSINLLATELLLTGVLSSPLVAALGSASAPAYTFENDTDTGMYSESDLLFFSTGGAYRGGFTSAGFFSNGPIMPSGQGTTGATFRAGSGSPEGVVATGVGSIYMRTDGGAGTSLYVKEGGGAGNTGWVAK
jgi:hypothetical protein